MLGSVMLRIAFAPPRHGAPNDPPARLHVRVPLPASAASMLRDTSRPSQALLVNTPGLHPSNSISIGAFAGASPTRAPSCEARSAPLARRTAPASWRILRKVRFSAPLHGSARLFLGGRICRRHHPPSWECEAARRKCLYLTQGVRPAGRYLDYSARRKIADGERMHAAQELFMEYGSLSFAYRLLVGFPRFISRAWATPLRMRPSIFALRPKNAAWTGTGRLRRASIVDASRRYGTFSWFPQRRARRSA